MSKLTISILLLVCVFSGCIFSSQSTKDSSVDTSLAKGVLNGSAPEAGPGAPQQAFDQESRQV